MADLPAERRDEILAEIEEHIAEDLAERPTASDADVRNVLERVGDPADIAAEARERFEIKPTRQSWTDPAAIILLLLGGFTIIGWFVGVVLLWISDAWNTRDKIIGTLVVPGGLAGALAIVLAAGSVPCEVTAPVGDPVGSCVSDPSPFGGVVGLTLGALVLIAPIVTAIYLARRLSQARLASDSDAVAAGAESRRRKGLMWVVMALVLLGVAVVVLGAVLSVDGGDPTRITEAQFERVALGDSKEEVSRALGEPGDRGSVVSGLDPIAVGEPEDVGDRQFDDCWLYLLTGSGIGPGSDAAVCFDSSDEVVYKEVRIAR